MKTYEFKCPRCGAVREQKHTLAPVHIHESIEGLGKGQTVVHFKRVWDFGLVWPRDKRGH